jgi:selenocysteine-specific elongation factor
VVLGTAGHIDHGKTALIRALTGVDTDRLPEERERGISIALGYAELALPSGRALSVVDVPGHERFVRTMVSGATGIDLFLMVVAADDGVMPQTREHATVLAALGVDIGVVAVTKADVADPGPALAAAGELLPGAEAVAVSSRTGDGLDGLRAALDRAADRVAPPGEDGGAARLHVDRVFTIRGAGTVVTGTLWEGGIAVGDHVRVLPAGSSARVRGVQIHDEPVERAGAGRRVALNLAGLGRDEIAPGDVVAAGEPLAQPAYRLDAALHWISPGARPDHGARLAVHHGTRAVPARLAELGGRFAQLRLEQPLIALRGDRLVIRSLAPPDTLGGGVVLDPAPPRHGPSRELLVRLTRLERGEEDEPTTPAAPPVDAPRAPELPPLDAAAHQAEHRLRAAGHEPPPDGEIGTPDALAALRAHGHALRLGRDRHIHRDALAHVRDRVEALAARDGTITLAALRDDLGTSRRYAQALLELLDAQRVTLRVGDARRLRRAARSDPPTRRPEARGT